MMKYEQHDDEDEDENDEKDYQQEDEQYDDDEKDKARVYEGCKDEKYEARIDEVSGLITYLTNN